jgi:glycosyltransferase involved in cell wall biosynthesis
VSDVASQASAARPLRLAVVGVSVQATCGVRDHATILADALARERVSPSMHWLTRRETSLPATRSELSAWMRRLSDELDRGAPDAVLLHYSVFSLSHRGVPLFVHPTLAAVHSSRIPLLAMMHELAYPWRYSGVRGDMWALSQRAALVDVMRAARGAIVTADARAQWLASRAWLPARPVLVAPVFSNLPAPEQAPARERSAVVVGLFGYSYEGAALSLVLDALALLNARGVHVQLRLLGAPGRGAPAGQAWLAAARARGLEHVLSFSEALPAQALSNALAACDLLLFADAAGPSSRKGTLAASLASGRPVVALDGPNSWGRLIDADAARVVAPTPEALAQAIGTLCAAPQQREQLGARGRSFAQREMGVALSVQVVKELLARVLGAGASYSSGLAGVAAP